MKGNKCLRIQMKWNEKEKQNETDTTAHNWPMRQIYKYVREFVTTETWPLLTRSKRKSCLLRAFNRQLKPFVSLLSNLLSFTIHLCTHCDWPNRKKRNKNFQKTIYRLRQSMFSTKFFDKQTIMPTNAPKSMDTQYTWSDNCLQHTLYSALPLYVYMHARS